MPDYKKYYYNTIRKFYSIFRIAEETKNTVLLVGKPGVGKSSLVYEYAKIRAKELNRKMVLWHELTEEEKRVVMSNVDKYYIVVDIKGGSISLDNLMIPFYDDKTKSTIWWVAECFKVFEKQESAGVLFLDEINATDTQIQSILFEIVLQRKIANVSLKSKNLLIAAAGNKPEDNEVASELTRPLKNRLVIINVDKYLLDWRYWLGFAEIHNIHKIVRLWVEKIKTVYYKTEDCFENDLTPRSLEKLSQVLYMTDDLEVIREFAYGLLPQSYAEDFMNFYIAYISARSDIDYTMPPSELYVVLQREFERLKNREISVKEFLDKVEKALDISAEIAVAFLRKLQDLALNDDKLIAEYMTEVMNRPLIREAIYKIKEYGQGED